MSETEPSALEISKREGLALKLRSKTTLSHFPSAFAAKHRLDHFLEGFRSILTEPLLSLNLLVKPKPPS